jgi:arsenate reductase
MIAAARMLSDTFAGIAPASVPMFVLAQLLGGAVAVAAVWALFPDAARQAGDVVVPHPATTHAADPAPGRQSLEQSR